MDYTKMISSIPKKGAGQEGSMVDGRIRKHKRILRDEVVIKIHPLKIIKFSILLLILLLVFFLGRWTAGSTASGSTASDCADMPDAVPAAPAIEDESPGFFERIASLFSSSDEGIEEEPAEPVESGESGESGEVDNSNAADNSSVSSDVTGGTTLDGTVSAAETAGNDTAEAEVSESGVEKSEEEKSEEVIITKYNKVSIALSDVYIDWKGTWGKVRGIGYTIKNNEAGTIKPSYFVMTMEKYDDIEKKISVDMKSRTITSQSTSKEDVIVPQGFSYNEVTVGDLADVEIKLVLFDSSGKPMASTLKNADLRGS